MRNFTWNRFPIKNLLIDSLLTPIVESTYVNRDMCKFESSQKDESRWQSTDSSKAYRNTSAFKCSLEWWQLTSLTCSVETYQLDTVVNITGSRISKKQDIIKILPWTLINPIIIFGELDQELLKNQPSLPYHNLWWTGSELLKNQPSLSSSHTTILVNCIPDLFQEQEGSRFCICQKPSEEGNLLRTFLYRYGLH